MRSINEIRNKRGFFEVNNSDYYFVNNLGSKEGEVVKGFRSLGQIVRTHLRLREYFSRLGNLCGKKPKIDNGPPLLLFEQGPVIQIGGKVSGTNYFGSEIVTGVYLLGVKELEDLFPHPHEFSGKITLEEALENIRERQRRY